MKRLDRIRAQVVAKVLSTDGWLGEDDPVEDRAFSHHASGLVGRHIFNQTSDRHRQIVERLLDLSTREFSE